MSVRQPKQELLEFGPVDHFDALHGQHDAAVAVCRNRDRWFEEVLLKDEARELVEDVPLWGGDTYFSQNGFLPYPYVSYMRRCDSNVRALTSCWVDLDYYNIDVLRDLRIEQVSELILSDHPWLPAPSTVIDSGRGGYLHWLFADRVHTSSKQKSRWQFAMEMLTKLLKPYGADPHTVDFARVLRIVGSTNTKNGAQVALVGNVVGNRVNFGEFTGQVLDNTSHLRKYPKRQQPLFPEEEKPKKQKRFSVHRDERAIGLHMDRLDDYRRLVDLRGGKLTDGRKRIMYLYAVSLTWVQVSREAAQREMTAFIAECFASPEDYTSKAVANVLELMDMFHAGVTKIWNGQGVDPRHRTRSTTIIRMLEITGIEQASLRTIIGAKEKDHRKEQKRSKDRERAAQKRRQAGMVVQEEYTQKIALEASERRSRALSLRGQGKTIGEIAVAVGVSRRTVHKYFESA